jgi:hypothetical protein
MTSKAEAEKKGIESAGGSAKLFQYVSTRHLSREHLLSRLARSMAVLCLPLQNRRDSSRRSPGEDVRSTEAYRRGHPLRPR